MADITHNDPVVTESKLTEFYNDIKPFLGCPAYLTSEGTSDYYSTDEKVIGRWTDGKPLYKKVIYFNPQITITANSWQNIKSDETDIEYIVDAIILRSDGVFIPQYGSVSPFIGTRGLWVYTTQLQNAIQGIILKYTKTTDSASTTIQEDPNEYSTDEKIVGKWIDGKPIYQKTFTGLSVVSTTGSSWQNIVSIPNVKDIIDARFLFTGARDTLITTYPKEYGSVNTNYLSAWGFSEARTITTVIVQYTKTTN